MENENTDTEKNSELTKSIKEITTPDFHFLIPSYQRGYRWKKEHVQTLLSDILAFHKHKKDPKTEEFYCLQPIVVKKKDDKWEVIDGQQRLTTLFLILKYIKSKYSEGIDLFKIHYDTDGRKADEDFLEKLDAAKKDENIDYFHLYEAHESIEKWFKEQAGSAKTTGSLSFALELFLTISNHVKIIWYEVDNKQDGREVFARLNTGKIPLTNAELIKALFLHNKNFKEGAELNSLELASGWDHIEYTLQDDKIWGFLREPTNNRENRIEYIFTLLSSDTLHGGGYALFDYYNKKYSMSIDKNILEKWDEVKDAFMLIEEWYKDHTFYHYIGYLVQIDVSLKEIFEVYRGKNKSDFKESLKNRIKEKLKLEDIDSYEYGNNNNKIIRRLLLLFNIEQHIHIQNDERFSFLAYNSNSQSIEHIRARNQENIGEKPQGWIDDHTDSLKRCYPNDSLIKKLEAVDTKNIASKDMQEIMNELFGEVTERYGEKEDEDADSVRNLCLLDRLSNSSLSNRVFDVKRAKIIKMQNDKYIPLATRRVFSKYYSETATSLFLWDNSDSKKYMKAIRMTLKFYLINDNERE